MEMQVNPDKFVVNSTLVREPNMNSKTIFLQRKLENKSTRVLQAKSMIDLQQKTDETRKVFKSKYGRRNLHEISVEEPVPVEPILHPKIRDYDRIIQVALNKLRKKNYEDWSLLV